LNILQDPFFQEATLEALAVLASGDDSLCFSLFSRSLPILTDPECMFPKKKKQSIPIPQEGYWRFRLKRTGLLVRNIEKKP